MNERVRELGQSRWALVVIAGIVIAGAAVYGVAHLSARTPKVPTFQVARGEFLDVLQFRGQLKAMKSITITAPANNGDLQILKIAADGTQVKKGDVVVEFDPSKTKQDLATDRSVLKSSQADIEQVRAQGGLNEEADTTALMNAKYQVEVAKLDSSKKEIVSRIEGDEANLKLADTEQSLRQAQVQLKSDAAVDHATIENKKNASRKAEYDAQRAETALSAMTLRAPADGTISLLSVWHMNGGEGPFKAGERAWPGTALAELPEAGSLRVTARVDETERGRLAVSQPVTLQFDAISDGHFTGKLERIGTIASSDFSAGWPIPRNFDLECSIDQADPRLKPRMNAQVTVIVDRAPNAIAIPTQASFLKSGRTVAYVWSGSAFQERTIQVGRKSRDRVLVTAGLNPGDLIALKDPSGKE